MSSRKIIISFSLCNFFFSFTSWMVFYYFPLYLKALGFSDSRIGILVSIFSLTSLFLIAFFGVLSDKFSPRQLVQTGIILLTINLCGLYFLQSFTAIFLLLVIGGCGSALYFVSFYSLYYRHLNQNRRGKKIGFFLLSAHLGFSLGPLLGGFISRGRGGEIVFAVGAGIMFCLFLLTFILKDSVPISFTLAKYKADLKRREVFLLFLVALAMGIHFGAERVSFSLFLQQDIGLNSWQIGQLFFFIGIWLGAFTIASGHLFDTNKKTITFLSLGLFISGVFHILTPWGSSYLSVLVIRLLHTAGDAFILLTIGLVVASIFPHKRMGGNFGFMETIRMGGAFLGAFGSGFLNNSFGYRPAFVLSGLLIIFASLYLIPYRKTLEKMLLIKE